MRTSYLVHIFMKVTVAGLLQFFNPNSRIGMITFLYLGIFPMIVLRCLFMEINRPGGLSSEPDDLALKI